MKRIVQDDRLVGRGRVLRAPFAGPLAVLWLLGVASPTFAADYSAKGALATSSQAVTSPLAARLAYPTAAGTYPWVFIAHEQGAQAQDQLALAQHLASHGLIAIVPELCSPAGSVCQPGSDVVVTKLATARVYLGSTMSPVLGKVDLEKVAVVGHGYGAFLVASAEPAPSPITRVLLDPVDGTGSTLIPTSVMSKQVAPVMSLFAPSHTCNGKALWEPFGVATKANAVAATVVGANHCDADPEWASCLMACGVPSAARSAKFRGLTTAWLLATMKGDPAAACAATPDTLKADPALTNVRSTFSAPCGAAGAGGSAGSSGKAGSSGVSGSSGKAGSSAGGKAGSGGSAAKAGGAGVAGFTASGGSVPSSPLGGGAGSTSTTGAAGAVNPDDGRNEYFELDQLAQEGLGDAESAPLCAVAFGGGGGVGWLVPLGLALALRRRSRGRA